LLDLTKNGNLLYLSAEFKDAITYGDVIVDAKKVGWSLTNTPAQPKAKIYKITKKIK